MRLQFRAWTVEKGLDTYEPRRESRSRRPSCAITSGFSGSLAPWRESTPASRRFDPPHRTGGWLLFLAAPTVNVSLGRSRSTCVEARSTPRRPQLRR